MSGLLINTPWGKIPPEARRAADLPAVPDALASGTAFCLQLSDSEMASLMLVAAHDGVSPHAFARREVAAAVVGRAEAIGLGVLCDLKSRCVGGAAVARRSHKPEVEGSSPSPATSIGNELADLPEFDRANVGRPRPPP